MAVELKGDWAAGAASSRDEGAQLRDDLAAMMQEQCSYLTTEIRESLERQTQVIKEAIFQWSLLETRANHKPSLNEPCPKFSSRHGASTKMTWQNTAASSSRMICEQPGANDTVTSNANLTVRATIACERLKEVAAEAILEDSELRPLPRRLQVARQLTKIGQKVRSGEYRKVLKEFAKSATFDLACGGMILMNAALIGAEVQFEASHKGEKSTVLGGIQTSFGVFFLIELMLRLHADGRDYLWSANWKWNLFDLVLVFTFIVDFVTPLVGDDDNTLSTGFIGRLIRAARFLRILRTLRLVRATSYAHEFRKMAYALQSSAHTLFWALLLLFLVLYCFATTFTQATTDFLKTNSGHIPGLAGEDICNPSDFTGDEREKRLCQLEHYWGTLPRSLYTLYASLTGGVSWIEVVVSLGDVDGVFFALFLSYISVAHFGVLNVVTSVFVECAMASTQHFMDLKIQETQTRKKMHVHHLREVFQDVDLDRSGSISIDELEELLKHAHLSAYLESIDIRKDDARLLFQLLDVDGSGKISIDEFCEGCLRLKGEAKSFDIHRFVWENKKTSHRLSTHIERVFRSINTVANMLRSTLEQSGVERNTATLEKLMKDTENPAAKAGSKGPATILGLPSVQVMVMPEVFEI